MELVNELRRMQERFTRHGVRTVVLDTNDLLHYMRFDKIPWQRLFSRGTSVMIPHVVIDEIDKKSYDTYDTSVRKRARGVFALLEQPLAQITPSRASGHYCDAAARPTPPSPTPTTSCARSGTVSARSSTAATSSTDASPKPASP
ncbi:PIN domain-containing protein [Streptomyces sp. cf124]|nr:PIN domain-containing protein [Streptomyces sp. cf124]